MRSKRRRLAALAMASALTAPLAVASSAGTATAAQWESWLYTPKLRVDAQKTTAWAASCPAGTIVTDQKKHEGNAWITVSHTAITDGGREQQWAFRNNHMGDAQIIRFAYKCSGTPEKSVRPQKFPDTQYDCNKNTKSCTTQILSETPDELIYSEVVNKPEAVNCSLQSTGQKSISWGKWQYASYTFTQGRQVGLTIGGDDKLTSTGTGLSGSVNFTLSRQESYNWTNAKYVDETSSVNIPPRGVAEIEVRLDTIKVHTRNQVTYRDGVTVYPEGPNDPNTNLNKGTWQEDVVAENIVLNSDGSPKGTVVLNARPMTDYEQVKYCTNIRHLAPTTGEGSPNYQIALASANDESAYREWDGTYTIGDAWPAGWETNYILDVRHNSTSDGAPVQTYWRKPSGDQNQQWILDPSESAPGYVYIMNARSGKCLDVQGESTAEGAPVTQYQCKTDSTTPGAERPDNQLWKLVWKGNWGEYELENKNSGKVLSVPASVCSSTTTGFPNYTEAQLVQRARWSSGRTNGSDEGLQRSCQRFAFIPLS
ncbi:RICIN domain-containing protein [Streptomyces sp. TRM64462]|uniref:RICIN domain-containing protein n=1 Tax=Streptomyces sp. TRM64462 TaxID=2741726 RepID=UPI0015869FD4|nr:RICIN domain-containing protein [Streptomyces sp. TRM64462]